MKISYGVVRNLKIHKEGPWGYIIKDKGRKKFKIEKRGIQGTPGGAAQDI
jgi:hypothetical protein